EHGVAGVQRLGGVVAIVGQRHLRHGLGFASALWLEELFGRKQLGRYVAAGVLTKTSSTKPPLACPSHVACLRAAVYEQRKPQVQAAAVVLLRQLSVEVFAAAGYTAKAKLA